MIKLTQPDKELRTMIAALYSACFTDMAEDNATYWNNLITYMKNRDILLYEDYRSEKVIDRVTTIKNASFPLLQLETHKEPITNDQNYSIMEYEQIIDVFGEESERIRNANKHSTSSR